MEIEKMEKEVEKRKCFQEEISIAYFRKKKKRKYSSGHIYRNTPSVFCDRKCFYSYGQHYIIQLLTTMFTPFNY